MPQRPPQAPIYGLDHPNASRLHDLLAALQAGEALNTDRAAEALGVSRRTIARDLKFLREDLGLDISYEQATRSYRLHTPDQPAGDGAPTHGALAAFLVARHALAALGGSTDRGLLEAATARLVEALPATLRVEEPATLAHAPEPMALSFMQIVSLHHAIERRHRVSLRTAEGAAVALVPRALLSRQGCWWVVAENEGEGEAFRFVPLVHLAAIRDLGLAATEAPALDLDALMAAHPILCDDPDCATYHLALTPAAAKRCAAIPPPFQFRLLEHERGADLYLCVPSVDEAARWCLWIGKGLRTDALDLRNAIVRAAEEIAAEHR